MKKLFFLMIIAALAAIAITLFIRYGGGGYLKDASKETYKVGDKIEELEDKLKEKEEKAKDKIERLKREFNNE